MSDKRDRLHLLPDGKAACLEIKETGQTYTASVYETILQQVLTVSSGDWDEVVRAETFIKLARRGERRKTKRYILTIF